MNEKELKDLLTEFKNTNFQFLGAVDVRTVTEAMLRHIGSTDPELRDSLIYPSFSTLIINHYYPNPELNRIMKVCLDEKHLFYHIDEVDEDAVFTRSFSSLIIAVLLHVNGQSNFLADEEVDQVATSLLDYTKKENDVRGFVTGKGWAHSIAHIADTLDQLVNQPQLKDARLEEIALTIMNKMYEDRGNFLYEEDERMVVPMISLLGRNLSPTIIIDFITRITDELEQNSTIDKVNFFIQRANIKQFLRSLMLHFEVINKHKDLQSHIKQALKSINRSYYNL